MSNEELIDDVMDQFDFKEVRHAMVALDWTWWHTKNGVPTLKELKNSARKHLEFALTKGTGYSFSGGLEATYFDGVLSLKFILAYADSPTCDSDI